MRKIENIANLRRPEVIEELRYVCRPAWFHPILGLSTPMLKAILMFYHEDGDDREVIGMIKEDRIKRGMPIQFNISVGKKVVVPNRFFRGKRRILELP